MESIPLGRTPEYRCWQSIRDRCYNPNNRDYAMYGGRGIAVCKRWRESSAAFLADMGPKPSPEHSIDRIDNDGDYSPENCRWATPAEQARNRKSSRLLTHNGETMTVAEWAERLAIKPGTLSMRLSYGWSVEKAVTTPVKVR